MESKSGSIVEPGISTLSFETSVVDTSTASDDALSLALSNLKSFCISWMICHFKGSLVWVIFVSGE